jgi:hypothetical protein
MGHDTSLEIEQPKPPLKPRRLIVACLAAVAGWFALDAALFRTNLYPSVLAPDSSAGTFELTLRAERLAQRRLGDNVICTLGDSRFAYSTKLANALTPETGYVFRNAGVPGSDPRVWYYMLRDLDPHANRYQAIVFGLTSYDDEDDVFIRADDMRSMHFIVYRLRWSDTFDLAKSFLTPQNRWQAFRGTLLKGFALQRDVHAFLDHPKDRIDYVHLAHQGFESWMADYVETKRNLAGLSIDWNTGKAVFPPNLDAGTQSTLEYTIKWPPSTEHVAEYRRLWFGRILDRYQGSRTRIVFLRLARNPIPRPGHPALPSSIRDLAKRPSVLLYDEHAFEYLERPELFKDAVHLNYDGVNLFSADVARGLARLLGPPRPASH